jgi:outer membrane protein assembly factor BamB
MPVVRRITGWKKYALWSAVGAVVLVAAGAVVWRVLGPAEVVTPAASPIPSPVTSPKPGSLGALINGPLIVDDQLRVYAAKRQIQADDQPAYRYETSPFWSYRRWPEQLIGVVHPPTSATSGVPVIIGSWSDGLLTAIDARTGRLAWQASAEVLGQEYAGRLTGSSVVWTPTGLLSGVTLAGKGVVVTGTENAARTGSTASPTSTPSPEPTPTATKKASLTVTDAAAGTQLWTVEEPGCASLAFTVPGAVIVPDKCDGATVLRRFDLGTGASTDERITLSKTVTPLGCRVGRSECMGVRVTDAAWIWSSDGKSAPAPGLKGATAWLAGTTAIDAPLGDTLDTRALTGKDPVTGAVRWTWNAIGEDVSSAQVIGTTSDRILLLTRARTLIAVNPADGSEITRVSVILEHDPIQKYAVGPVYAAGPYVAIERLSVDYAKAETDDEYYYTNRPVLLAAS